MTGKTLYDKVWERNVVVPETPDTPAILHIGLHLIHEVTSPQAFAMLAEQGLRVRRPDLTLATMDHSTPTLPAAADGTRPYATSQAQHQVEKLVDHCTSHGIELLDYEDDRRGIVHLIGPELGRTRPGMVIVCGDSHTSTHGAFGAMAFGIGTSEVGHVLATQALFQRKAKTMRVTFDGTLPAGVTAKDMALAFIAKVGIGGATGHVIEYAGEAVRSLSMEGRMTLCNMSIEAGARAGMVAPDETTFSYLRDRLPSDTDWQALEEDWRTLSSDNDATFDQEVVINVADLSPMVTFGTTPDAATSINDTIPLADNDDRVDAYQYMGLTEGQAIGDIKVSKVFIGSCTNGRMEDIRAVANILRGRKISPDVTLLVVPGSGEVKRAAEAEGLDAVITQAGGEWRLPGCSMCLAMNGDQGAPGEVVVSTSNRNFKGRQGEGVRTILASPATAAASAIAGVVADPRAYTPRKEEAAA